MINKIKLFIKNDTYEYGFSKKYIYYQDIVKIAEKHNLDESLLNEEIKKENNIFIKFQIQVYLKEFKEYLFNRRLEIDDDERQNLKLKYNKNYFNFYKKLNFDELIDIRAFLINIFIDNGDLKEYNNLL